MAANLAKWPSNRGLISKLRPSDGCKETTVPSTVIRGYDLRKLGGHLGNVGSRVPTIISDAHRKFKHEGSILWEA